MEGGCQGVHSLVSKKQTLCDSLGYTVTVWKDNDFRCANIHWEITGQAKKGGEKNGRWEEKDPGHGDFLFTAFSESQGRTATL